MPKQATFYHHGMRVQSTSAPKRPGHAVMISAPEFGLELTRERAESLITLLSMALDLTGPRERVPIDLSGPDAPVFVRRQAD